MVTHFTKYSSIIITGSIAYDDIMVFPGYFKDFFHPEKLHQINVSFAVNSLVKHIGGTATNISHSLRCYSTKKISVLGAMGQDHHQLSDFFKENTIDISGSYIDEKLYTSTGKVITDKADNQIWGFYYGAAEKGDEVDFAPYIKDSFAIISANHEKAFLHAQTYFIQNNVPYLYDPGMSLTWIQDSDLKTGIDHCQFLIGNDYEIAQITKRLHTSVQELVAKGIGVITTLGSEGVKYEDAQQLLIVKGYKVKQLVDPTGAGDAWRGGFIGSLVEGNNMGQSLTIANALASFAVEQQGTANHNPSREEIEERAKKLEIQ